MARPPLSELRVTRRTNQRVYAGLWVASAVPWIIAAALDGGIVFIGVAVGWSIGAAASVADLWSWARLGEGRLTSRRFWRERVVDLAGARIKSRRREIAVIDAGDAVVFRFYPDRDQMSVGKDPRPMAVAEVTEAILARIDEAEALGPGGP